MSSFIRVELPYAVFGIEVEDGIVTDAAPIANWMIRHEFEEVKQWIIAKGGSWMELS